MLRRSHWPFIRSMQHQLKRGLCGSSSRQAAGTDGGNVGEYVVEDRIRHLHIMTIGINRPEKRNCVNRQVAQELVEAFHRFEADDSMHCAVLHGVGGNFCAGYDLSELASMEEGEVANMVAGYMGDDRGPMGPSRMETVKPVVAAIDGWCVAGGLELALMADLRVADQGAKLGVLNRRFGVPLIDGGSVRLPEIVGMSRALDLILTGRVVQADEAMQMGLVNRVVKTGQAFGRAMHLAREITNHPQECLRADRASVYYSMFVSKSFQDSLQFENQNGLPVLTKESIRGAKKFMAGMGKHGKFNVEPVAEKQDWQVELEEMMKAQEPESQDVDKKP